jgi:hypothetical protein
MPDGGVLDAGALNQTYEHCPAAGLSVEGTIDSQTYQTSTDSRGVMHNTAGRTYFAMGFSLFGTNGLLYVATSTVFDTVEQNAQAILLVPDDTPGAGDLLCGKAQLTSIRGINEDILVNLKDLHRLPDCASASATSDRLSYCSGRDFCDASNGGRTRHTIRGTINGRSVDLEEPDDNPLGRIFSEFPDGSVDFLFANGRGYATLDSQGRGQLIWAGETADEAPLVFCVEAATVTTTEQTQRVEFTDLRLRGPCEQSPTVDGTLQVCGG